MNEKKSVWCRRWLPVIVWLAVIFAFSQTPGEDSSRQSGRLLRLLLWIARLVLGEERAQALPLALAEFVIRKLAHFTEFTVLGILLSRAQLSPKSALTGGILYAGSDEVHQYFIPGRAMALRDVGIDSLGVAFGVFLYHLFRRRRRA